MANSKVRVRVPASTANLGPGFDTLGMALELYAWMELGLSDQTRIELYGEQLSSIPANKNNLIYKVAQKIFAEAGVHHPELEISMYTEFPLTRGLGSSATAIVGAMYAANELIGSPLSRDDIFQLATRMEDHPDNVGASLFGGIIAASWDGIRADHIRIEPHEQLEVLVVIPSFHLSTDKARLVLPKQVSMKDAVFNISHSSMLVAALCTGRMDMIKYAMKDVLHQPYRSRLIPGMDTILREAVDHGALGIALSGAGPTLIAFADQAETDKAGLESFLQSTMANEGIQASTVWLKPCLEGAKQLTADDSFRTFIEKNKGEVRA